MNVHRIPVNVEPVKTESTGTSATVALVTVAETARRKSTNVSNGIHVKMAPRVLTE